MYKIFLILLSIWLCIVDSLNILVIFPSSAKSHFMVFEPLFKTLAAKEHNLTVISYFPQENPLSNYRDVRLQMSGTGVEVLSINDMITTRMTHYLNPIGMAALGVQNCRNGLQSPVLIEFLKEKNNFDVILAEMFNTNCYLGLIKKYQAPFIGLSCCVVLPYTNDWMGNPSHPAYIPNVFMDYSDQLTYLERLENTLMYFYTRIIYRYRMEIPGNELSKKYLGRDVLDHGNIMYNMSLLLANTHFSLNLPRPLVPSFIEVGGIHVGTPKNLTSNIERWINEVPEGVIYFSLGSLIKTKTFPKDKLNIFLNVFKRLPQRVLWKWEDDIMEGKPDNLMTQKWMPQFDILCHPNVKAFISHGGLLGTTESIHCGVPMVIMPQFGDQFTNAKAVEAVGTGVVLKLKDITEKSLYEALQRVLNKHFRQKAKEQAIKFRDRPLPPMDTAIYWIEYVARHSGAHHMRTAVVNMPFYKYYLLDVACFLLATISLYIYISYRILCFLCSTLHKLLSSKLKIN